MLRRILRVAVIGWIATMVGGAIAAMQIKRQVGPASDERADEIVASAIFGPLAYHSTATALRSGRIELWYGGGVLDLRDATLAPGGATLTIRAVFGGGQILVPAGWRVETHVRGLGGLQDVRSAKVDPADPRTLTIDGVVIAGGFVVQSELDPDAAEWLESMDARQDGARDAMKGVMAGEPSDLTSDISQATGLEVEPDATSDVDPAATLQN